MCSKGQMDFEDTDRIFIMGDRWWCYILGGIPVVVYEQQLRVIERDCSAVCCFGSSVLGDRSLRERKTILFFKECCVHMDRQGRV